VFDEARHMEFFTKYLSEIEGKIYPPSEELSRLLGRTFAENRWVIKMAMCQIVIESLAMAKFQRIRKESKVPLLRYAIDYIIKDEARHVSFGVETLKKHVNQLCSVEKEELANITLESVFELANGFKTYIQIGASYGWDLVDMRRHLRMVQIKKPMLRREIFRQLSLNLEAVGLLTEGAKTLLRERRLV
jgi:ribonucleotide reductase beta subunit family protein with ferritin-like domain